MLVAVVTFMVVTTLIGVVSNVIFRKARHSEPVAVLTPPALAASTSSDPQRLRAARSGCNRSPAEIFPPGSTMGAGEFAVALTECPNASDDDTLAVVTYKDKRYRILTSPVTDAYGRRSRHIESIRLDE